MIEKPVLFSMEKRVRVLSSNEKNMPKSDCLNLLHYLQHIDERFIFQLICVLRYQLERKELFDTIRSEEVQGDIVKFTLSQLKVVKANALDKMIDQIFPSTKDIVQDSFDAITSLAYLQETPLVKNFSISLKSP